MKRVPRLAVALVLLLGAVIGHRLAEVRPGDAALALLLLVGAAIMSFMMASRPSVVALTLLLVFGGLIGMAAGHRTTLEKETSESQRIRNVLNGPGLVWDESRKVWMLNHQLINQLPDNLHPMHNPTARLPGFAYDDRSGRFIHEESGFWYVIRDGRRVVPAEHYLEQGRYEIAYVWVECRPDDVWEHVSTTEVVVQAGDNLAWIGSVLPWGYRMSWSFGQAERERFLARNNIKDPDLVYPGQLLVYYNYVDREAPQSERQRLMSYDGRFQTEIDGAGRRWLRRIAH